jgi:hypothetical protein
MLGVIHDFCKEVLGVEVGGVLGKKVEDEYHITLFDSHLKGTYTGKTEREIAAKISLRHLEYELALEAQEGGVMDGMARDTSSVTESPQNIKCS